MYLIMEKAVVILIICSILQHLASADITLKKGWTSPDQFGRNHNSRNELIDNTDSTSCPVCEAATVKAQTPTGDISVMFYKRLIAKLFDRKKLEYNPFTNKYSRAISFDISEEQLRRLEQSEDSRDWDGIMAEVFSNIRTHRMECPESSEYGFSMLPNVSLNFLQISEVRFTLILLLAGFLIFYLNKKLKHGIIYIFIGGMFIFGYLYTYFECNRQLEIDELVALKNSESNPCDEEQESFSIWNFYKRSAKDKCIEHLRNKNKLKLPYCHPDEVFIRYMNKIFFQQFQMITDQSVDVLKSCAEKIPFPYNIVAMITVPFLLVFIIRLMFQYVITPSAWRTTYPPDEKRRDPIKEQIAGGGDQLSGENLALFLETVRTSAIRAETPLALPVVSGVQDIEVLPALKEKESPEKKMSFKNETLSESDDINDINTNNNDVVK